MHIQLSKIPSVVRHLDLPYEVEISENIIAEEGTVITVEALNDQGTNNVLDFATGRLGKLVEGDVIPGVLGKRRALREFSGDIPETVNAGDILYLLCESGVFGEVNGYDERWGIPMKVKVLGSIVQDGKALNMKDAAIEWKSELKQSAPIVAVIGTSMDIGKTTAICKLVKYFKSKGLDVAAAKLAGVAFTQDPLKISDAGASPVIDFSDAGLPSTCGEGSNVVQAALGVLTEINKSEPDLIIAEFGDGILGEYHVADMLQHPDIRKHIKAVILGASDLVSVWGAKHILDQFNIPITVVTGPAVNNQTSTSFIEKNIGVHAESNLHEMPKTQKLVDNTVFSNVVPMPAVKKAFFLSAVEPKKYAANLEMSIGI